MRTLTIALCSLIAAWMIVPATAQILRRRAYVEPAVCQGGNCGPQAALQAPIFVPQAVITVETLTVPPRAPVIALVKEPQAAAKKDDAKPMPVGDGPTVVYAPAPAYAAPVLFGSRRTPLRSFVRRLLGR